MPRAVRGALCPAMFEHIQKIILELPLDTYIILPLLRRICPQILRCSLGHGSFMLLFGFCGMDVSDPMVGLHHPRTDLALF